MRTLASVLIVLAACTQTSAPPPSISPGNSTTTTTTARVTTDTSGAPQPPPSTLSAPAEEDPDVVERLRELGVTVERSDGRQTCHLANDHASYSTDLPGTATFSIDTFSTATDLAAAASALPACPALWGAHVDPVDLVSHWIVGLSIVSALDPADENHALPNLLREVLGSPIEYEGPWQQTARRRPVEAQVHTGTGDGRVNVEAPGPVVVTLIFAGAGGTARVLDDTGELTGFARTSEAGAATTTAGMDGSRVSEIVVTSDGGWIAEIRAAHELAERIEGTRTGWGVDVIVLEEPLEEPQLVRVAHHGRGRFTVRLIDESFGPSSVVDDEGVFSGGAVLHAGTVALEIVAEGAWAISTDDTADLEPVVPRTPGRRWFQDGVPLAPFPADQPVTLMSGPDHCEWDDTDWLTLSAPIVESVFEETPHPHWIFIRQGPGRVDVRFASQYERDAMLPVGAIPTTFIDEAGWALWIDPEDTTAVYIVKPTGIEKWPRPIDYLVFCV